MRIVSYDSGTLIALFSLEAFLPLRFTGQRALLDLIGDVYNFAKTPEISTSLEELEQNGLEFRLGEVELDGEMVAIQRLSIHQDGILIAAPTTDDAERVYDHLQAGLKSQDAFRDVSVTRLYLSQIIVDFDTPPEKLFRSFSELQEIVSVAANQGSRPVETSALSQIAIELRGPRDNQPKFIIERRVGSELDQNRFYCSAPLRTKDHVHTLEAIERLAS